MVICILGEKLIKIMSYEYLGGFKVIFQSFSGVYRDSGSSMTSDSIGLQGISD